MTIIAYANKQIACDSLVCYGDRKHYTNKFKKLDDGRIAFVAGNYAALSKAVRRLNKGLPLTEGIVKDSTIVVFNPLDGSCVAYDESIDPEDMTGMHTWGSGSSYGIATIEMGGDAVRACQVAKKYSSSCGGTIHLFESE